MPLNPGIICLTHGIVMPMFSYQTTVILRNSYNLQKWLLFLTGFSIKLKLLFILCRYYSRVDISLKSKEDSARDYVE